MFKIFIDYNKLVDIIEREPDDAWHQILMKQNEVGVNHYIEDNEDDPLFLFSLNGGNIEFCDETEYMNEVVSDNKKVLDNPCGAFYLNIDSTKAKEIQDRFGVICQNCEDMNSKFLTIGDITITTTRPNTWQKKFPFGQIVPSNSLIIMDRYLFCSENKEETINDSIENIKDMMNAFMPQSFDAEYHLCIIFDATLVQTRDNTDFAKISTALNKIKNEFSKIHGYNISLELLSCDKRDSESYKKTHDRKVFSNYYYVAASHKLKAFRNGNPLTKQKIDLLSLYAKGLSGDLSDVPQYAHEDDIKDLRSIVREAKKHPILYGYSYNGNANIETKDIKNRILV